MKPTSLKGQRYEYKIGDCKQEQGADLKIYSAVRNDDKEPCEAHFFEKYRLPNKLYLSRKRRIQRLKRSSNFMEFVDQDNHRAIITKVCQHRFAPRDPTGNNMGTTAVYDLRDDVEFPPLETPGR
ncbi:hypothetical protein F5Y16DRAFT_373019 [Xylariaceae sp. FL0255]|nr:hypothetical protein F5Y16DRAFT_373019 [Xylariaceae sp. FL0255]